MRENRPTDFRSQDFHIGIDVHKKNNAGKSILKVTEIVDVMKKDIAK